MTKRQRGLEHRAGFTIVELLIVISLIMVLVGMLLPALNAVRTQSQMAKSMSNMRQIGTFMRSYEQDNRDTILPSQFDYSQQASYRGRAAAPADYEGADAQMLPAPYAYRERHQGTWADILWTVYELGRFPQVHNEGGQVLPHDYSRVAPDRHLYDALGSWDGNPLRSAAKNSRDAAGGTGDGIPRPYGDGAHEAGLPGFFAANNFFDARTGQRYTTGQIRSTARSLYLVDSFYGETIDPIPEPWDTDPDEGVMEVDFRYGGVCLMLFMDGSVSPESRWRDLNHLQQDRQIRVQCLHVRSIPPDGICP